MMVQWVWIPISLMIGAIIGMFVRAFAEISRREEDRKRWWEE